MNVRQRSLLVCVSLFCVSVTADAQWKIEFDSTYGRDGKSVDATAAASASSVHPHKVVIADDGSAFIIREFDSPDTTRLVGRVLNNGHADPGFDEDGMIALDKLLTTASYVLAPNDGLWFSASRAGRLELWKVDLRGRLGSTPYWQDTAIQMSNKILGKRGEDTLVMWSNRWADPESPQFIRYVVPDGVNPSYDAFIPYEASPIEISLDEARMDSKGRIMAFGNVSDRSYAIARYTEAGILDVKFGNAMGLAVFEKSPNDGVLWMDVLSLKMGGYVIVMPIFERKGNAHDYFVRLLKITEDGDPVSTFGVDGVLDIRGSQMTSRGIVECPNGDLLFASFGTYAYSHLYQIRPDGTFIPNAYGDFGIISAIQLLKFDDEGHLYGISGDATTERYVLSRFTVATVTSVDERDHSPLEISIDQGVISVKGATEPVTIGVYSLLGQCVLTASCDANSTLNLPHGVSGTYIVSASSGRETKTEIVVLSP